MSNLISLDKVKKIPDICCKIETYETGSGNCVHKCYQLAGCVMFTFLLFPNS